jgi:putative transposase
LIFGVVKTSRFNEGQIIKAIKEHEGGRKAEDIVRDLGISQGTFYKWKQKYGGMDASDVKRLKDHELENSRLKRLLAETILDKEILKDVIKKKAGARRVEGARHDDTCALQHQPSSGPCLNESCTKHVLLPSQAGRPAST